MDLGFFEWRGRDSGKAARSGKRRRRLAVGLDGGAGGAAVAECKGKDLVKDGVLEEKGEGIWQVEVEMTRVLGSMEAEIEMERREGLR